MMEPVGFDPHVFDSMCEESIRRYSKNHDLPSHVKEEIVSSFGCPNIRVKGPCEFDPASIEEIEGKQIKYLEKQQAKGLISDLEVKNIMNRVKMFDGQQMVRTSEDTDVNVIDVYSLYTQDPYIKFWTSKETVKNIINELSGLPFCDNAQGHRAVNKFYDLIAGYIRNERAREPKRKNKAFYHDQMLRFVRKAHELRKQIISNLIINKYITTIILSDALRTEFSGELASIEEKKNTIIVDAKEDAPSIPKYDDNDNVLMERANKYLHKLPPLYQISNNVMGESKDRKIEKSKSTISSRLPPLSSLSSKSNVFDSNAGKGGLHSSKSGNFRSSKKRIDKKERAEKTEYFWFNEDPLHPNREGEEVNIFKQINDLTHFDIEFKEPDMRSICIPGLLDEDFTQPTGSQPTAVVIADDSPLLTDSIWNTMQMGEEVAIKENLYPKDSDSLNVKTHATNTNSVPLRLFTDSYRYLINHIRIIDSKTDAPLNKDMDKFEECLRDLEYPSFLKLELYKKYSRSTDDISKISNILSYWIRAVDVLHLFDKSFNDLKNQLTLSPNANLNDQSISPFKTSFEISAQAMMDISDTIRKVSGDTIYFRGISCPEFILGMREQISRIW